MKKALFSVFIKEIYSRYQVTEDIFTLFYDITRIKWFFSELKLPSTHTFCQGILVQLSRILTKEKEKTFLIDSAKKGGGVGGGGSINVSRFNFLTDKRITFMI